MSAKKRIAIGLMFSVTLFCSAVSAPAATVYFQDGTRMEVESITRVGDSVCLLVDPSTIDTSRTVIQEIQERPAPAVEPVPVSGLSLEHVDFSPSEDGRDIIATGEVVNHSANAVQNVQVLVTLKDKEARKLLAIKGYVRPGRLDAGQRGTYRLQVQKPQGFWKAGIDVQGEAVE